MNTDPAYDGYREWKQWDRLFDPQPHESALFAKEFRGITITGKRWLDIGFGSGALLGWARSQGASIAGIEIQPGLREAAEAQGIKTFDGLDSVPDASFDIVTAFDVLEHISRDKLGTFLENVCRIATPHAVIVFRVPNCQSPLGLINQFGDPTHVTMLSGPILSSLCNQAGMDTIIAREAEEPGSSHRQKKQIIRQIIAPMQSLLHKTAKLLHRLLWMTGKTPLSKNVIIFATIKNDESPS